MSESERDDICGEEYTNKEGVCDNKPTQPDGKCGFHTDVENTFEEENWRPTEDHGLYNSEYYESLPEEEQRFVDVVSDDLIEKSRYTKEDPSMFEKCRQIAVDLHQKRRADGYVARKGLTQENTVGFHEEHGEITETQENVLMVTKDRLSRESRLSMKDLGILDEDEGQMEEAAETMIERLSKDMEE